MAPTTERVCWAEQQTFVNLIHCRNLPAMFSRHWSPWTPNPLDTRLTPEALKQRVLKSARMARVVEELAGDDARKAKELLQQVAEMLNEIGIARSLPIIRTLGTMLNSILTRILDGLYVNSASLERLKTTHRAQPVLYLPSHRSYADFILMSYVCFSYNVEIPAIAAGLDFFKMAGMGEVLRKTGAFFMRRSFASDKLYWSTFKQYVHALMTIYHSGIEFFIEGTRSRSCKSLTPRIGLLSMALEPLYMGEIPDVTIVPVSIAYERPLEEQLFVYELLGVPKPKESTRGLFKSLSILKQNFGSIYFQFGQPISVKEYLGVRLDRYRHALEPSQVQLLAKDELGGIQDLAYDVLDWQQDGIVLLTFNLVAVCFNWLSLTKDMVYLHDLRTSVAELKDILRRMGAIVAFDDREDDYKQLNSAISTHKNILRIEAQNGKVELVRTLVEMAKIDKNLMKAHKLSDIAMKNSIPVFSLQIYINPCLYWIVRPAILLLAARKLGSEFSFSALVRENNLLRAIFAHEFALYTPKESKDLDKSLKILNIFGLLLQTAPDRLKFNQTNRLVDLFLTALAPFVCSYHHTAKILLDVGGGHETSERQILVSVQSKIEELLWQRARDVHPYCLCLDSISLALQAFCALGGLRKERKNGSAVGYWVEEGALKPIADTLEEYSGLLSYDFLYYNAELVKARL